MRFTRTWKYLQPAAAVLAACALFVRSSTKPVATETAAPSVYATPRSQPGVAIGGEGWRQSGDEQSAGRTVGGFAAGRR